MKDNPSSQPSLLLAIIASLAVVGLMAWLRFIVFPTSIIPLTYALGLLLALWHRDRKLHWGTAVILMVMATVKTHFWMPREELTPMDRWAFWGMQLLNIAVVGVVVQLINNYRARLEAEHAALVQASAELEAGNEELAVREEEVINQNEELQQQAEELQQQAEELEAQSEELRAINEESSKREETLEALFDLSTNLGRDETDAAEQICAVMPRLIDGVDAAAILVPVADVMRVRAQTGLGDNPTRTSIDRERSLANLVIERGETGFVADMSERPDLQLPAGDKGEGFRSALVTPLRVNGKIGGVLEVYCCEPRTWQASEVRLIEWLGYQCAKVWEMIRLQRERQEAQEALQLLNQQLEKQVTDRTAVAQERAERLKALTIELVQTEHRERRRLAKLLHDELQQNLVAAKLHASSLRRHESKPEVSRAADLVSSLLSRAIETSRTLTVELSPAVLHDAGLVPGLQWLCRMAKERHGLQATLEAPPELPVVDEDLRIFVFEAVRELLFNVVKHADTPTASVRLSTEPGPLLLVTVSDDGQGFPTTAQSLSNSSGFGLFGMQQRVESLNGSLSIDSIPGHGCTVQLKIPFRIPSSPISRPIDGTPATVKTEQAVYHPNGHDQGGAEKTISILLVDDHAIVRQGLATLINREPGMAIIGEAADGHEALECVRRLSPEVVIMDVSMPRMDGIEATRHLSAEFPHVAVIGLSMFDQADRGQAMLQAGARFYLCKGGPLQQLIDAIRACAGVGGEPGRFVPTSEEARS